MSLYLPSFGAVVSGAIAMSIAVELGYGSTVTISVGVFAALIGGVVWEYSPLPTTNHPRLQRGGYWGFEKPENRESTDQTTLDNW